VPLAVFVPAQLNDLATDVAVGTPAQGAVFYRGAATWNALAAGTAGRVLTTNGAGADPTWAAIPAADLSPAVILAPATDARNVIVPTADTTKALVVKRFSGTHSENLLEVQDESGVAMASITRGGAANFSVDPNAYGAGYAACLVLGDLSGPDGSSDTLMACGRYIKSNVPFVTFSGQDNGESNILYFGGGDWGVPDANEVQFWTASTYTETPGTGSQRIRIEPSGKVVFNDNKVEEVRWLKCKEFYVNGSSSDPPAVGWSNLKSSESSPILNLYSPSDQLTAEFGSSGLDILRVWDAGTNSVVPGLKLGHNTSGIPAAGFGNELRFTLESTGNNEDQEAGGFSAEWETATHASRNARLKLFVYNVTTKQDAIQIDGKATNPTIILNPDNANLRINNQTSGAAANAGTLGNAPSAGNPSFWLPINIAGNVRYIPCWT
jgi:hypothetical protein